MPSKTYVALIENNQCPSCQAKNLSELEAGNSLAVTCPSCNSEWIIDLDAQSVEQITKP